MTPAAAEGSGRPDRRRRRATAAVVVLGVLAVVAFLVQTPPRERVPHVADLAVADTADAGGQGHAPGNTLEAFGLDETRSFSVGYLAGAHRWWRPPDRLAGLLAEHQPRAAAPEHVGLRVTRWMQDRLAPLTPVLLALSHIGDEEFYLLVFPLLYWCGSASVGIRVGVILLLSAGTNAVVKLGTASPRPFFLDPDVGLVTETSFGIPSGHAQNGAAVVGLLAAEIGRPWAWVAAIPLILLLGLSRIHLGAHFPEDVLIGWALGGLLLVAFLRWRQPATAWWRARSAASRVAAAFLGSSLLIAVGATVRTALTGWQWPTEWVGAGAAVDDATGLAAVVTPAAALFGLAVGLVAVGRAGGYTTAGPLWQRLLRFPVGLIGVIVLWQGLGAVLPSGETAAALAARYLRYALIGGWVAGFAPLLFMRLKLAQPPLRAPARARERG